jgi:hypothetical protein
MAVYFRNWLGHAIHAGWDQKDRNKLVVLPSGTSLQASALKIPSPHDGVMTRPVEAHPYLRR